jgi:hypothetical protein
MRQEMQDIQTIFTSNLNHRKAGLLQQIQQARKKIASTNQALIEVHKQIAAVLSEYRKLVDIHDIWDRDLPNHDLFTRRQEGQLDKARNFFFAAICAGIFAIVVGVYFSFLTMNAKSPMILILGSVVVASVLGVISAMCLRTFLEAHPENPKSIKRVNLAIGIIGLFFLVFVSTFAWLRFRPDSPIILWLPTIIVGLELSSILLAGAFDCGYRIYHWSAVLDNKFRKLDRFQHDLENELAESNVRLQEHEFALDQLQSVTPISSEEDTYESTNNHSSGQPT